MEKYTIDYTGIYTEEFSNSITIRANSFEDAKEQFREFDSINIMLGIMIFEYSIWNDFSNEE